MGIKGLIWDMDGTLLNTLDDIIGACNATLKAYGLEERSKSEMLSLIGYGARHLCQGASRLEGERLEQFMKDYRARAVTQGDPTTHVYAGVSAYIAETRSRGIRHAIYTNKPQFWSQKLAVKFFPEGTFDYVLGTTEEGILKPDPEYIYRICRGWGFDLSEVVMIGDSPVDWEVAQRAGCGACCVSWGFRSRKVLEDAGATCICDKVDEFWDKILL